MSARRFKTLSVLVLAAYMGDAFGESPTNAEKPIWARSGQLLALDCQGVAPSSAESTHGDALVSFECIPNEARRIETLQIRYKNKRGANFQLAVPLKDLHEGHWRPQEILWSPDGLAFLINGSENAYAGTDYFVFRAEDNALVRKAISSTAQNDMLERLARCWPFIREIVGSEPLFNMSAISWTGDALNVFAEVPCSSRYENSMCSVYGYEVNARTGDVSKVLSAAEVNNTWYMHMSWKMAASDLPSCDPHTGKVSGR